MHTEQKPQNKLVAHGTGCNVGINLHLTGDVSNCPLQ